MCKWPLVIFLLILTQTELITAQLKLVQYDPYMFCLRFSEIIERPKFQLMLNNVHRINYTIINNLTSSDSYYFQTSSTSSIPHQIIQNYQLIFNYPLQVGSGRLGQKYYKLVADKAIVEIPYQYTWGVLVITASYLAANLSNLGIVLFEFLEIYSLMMFRNTIKTQLYHQISKDLLLLNPVIADNLQIYFPICGPLLIVIGFGIIGYTVKRLIPYPNSIGMRILYDYIVYDLFVCVTLTFILPLFYNSIQFIYLASQEIIQNGSTLATVGYIFSYLGLISTIAIVYLFAYKTNPKIGQDHQSWNKYIKSSDFHMFGKLHSHIRLQNWYSRNYSLILILKRMLIGCLFFAQNSFEISVFFIQFCNIYYVFTIRPIKHEIYTNICMICRLLMFLYYGLVVVGDLYFSLSNNTASFLQFQYYLHARQIVFLFITLLIFLVMFYQVYGKFSNLNYRIKVVKEENQFKIKIIENKNIENDSNWEKEEKRKNFIEQEEMPELKEQPLANKKYSTYQEIVEIQRKSLINSEKLRKQSIEYSKSIDAEQRMSKSLKSSISESKIKRNRTKWKKESLLVQILKKS